MTPSVSSPDDPRVDGEAMVYRLFDVGYAIALDRAFDLLASSGPERRRPSRAQAKALQIPNPPVTVGMGSEPIIVEGNPVSVDVSARVFDFGVVALRARVIAPAGLSWRAFAVWGSEVNTAGWQALFVGARDELLARIISAVEQPAVSPITEDYTVFRINRLVNTSGENLLPTALEDGDIAALLLGERRPVVPTARQSLLSRRFSYFDDDLTVLTWSSALVVEPDVDDGDVQYLLEFANAQLLELRWYDAILDAEVPALQSRFKRARLGFRLLGRRYSELLESLQQRVADSVDVIERVENSLKVTDDVYLAQVYAAALEEFRERTWRNGIDRKIAIVRDTYDMLNADSLARRGEILEFIVVLLIMFEIGLALLRR